MSQKNRVYLRLYDISMWVHVVICAGFTYTYIINSYVGVGNVWTNHTTYYPGIPVTIIHNSRGHR